jgi:hypothetical protein
MFDLLAQTYHRGREESREVTRSLVGTFEFNKTANHRTERGSAGFPMQLQ